MASELEQRIKLILELLKQGLLSGFDNVSDKALQKVLGRREKDSETFTKKQGLEVQTFKNDLQAAQESGSKTTTELGKLGDRLESVERQAYSGLPDSERPVGARSEGSAAVAKFAGGELGGAPNEMELDEVGTTPGPSNKPTV